MELNAAIQLNRISLVFIYCKTILDIHLLCYPFWPQACTDMLEEEPSLASCTPTRKADRLSPENLMKFRNYIKQDYRFPLY